MNDPRIFTNGRLNVAQTPAYMARWVKCGRESAMDELRVVRREEQSLIVTNEAGDEFRLIVDSSVLADLRHLARQASGGARINPREIQSLVRAGKTRAEIIELTGAEEGDIERYEEPVLAERRFLLSSAQSVPVRTSPSEQSEEQFGVVIAERLVGLVATSIKWSSWRDEEAGWMIGLDFDSHGVSHHAVWSFEHRKRLLSPLTPDAITLSKQGEVGDRLIPKLRAVDASDSDARFDSDAFNRDELQNHEQQSDSADPAAQQSDPSTSDDTLPSTSSRSAATAAALRAGHPSTASIPVVNPEDEFARRREIDQRAIKSPEPEPQDLGQTADLLDALRRRRGAREDDHSAAPEGSGSEHSADSTQLTPLRGIGDWQGEEESDKATEKTSQQSAPSVDGSSPTLGKERADPQSEPRPLEATKRGKGRSPIPSWDDILFGTRSEDDPS